ncbi:MAG: YbaN family protein [Alphaproteobacteria bacterium]|nr:YbaN family protein [Alphaproteobacteria bacterium]
MADATEPQLRPNAAATDPKDAVVLAVLRLAGVLCLGLGIVGAFVPLLPATCFLIVAAICFAKSAPRWRRRILAHPRFGPPVRAFLEDGTLSRRAKILSVSGIAVNYALTIWLAGLTAGPAAVVGAILALVAFYIMSRPEPARRAAISPIPG